MPSHPGEVTRLTGRGGYHPIPIFRYTRDGDVCFDARAFVEPLTVNDPTVRHIDIGGAQAIEKTARIRTRDLVFRKARLVEEGCRFPYRPVLSG